MKASFSTFLDRSFTTQRRLSDEIDQWAGAVQHLQQGSNIIHLTWEGGRLAWELLGSVTPNVLLYGWRKLYGIVGMESVAVALDPLDAS